MINQNDIKSRLAIQKTLTIINSIGLFTILIIFIMGYDNIAEENKSFITVLIGAVSTVYIGSMGFWFSSSFGSKEKDSK